MGENLIDMYEAVKRAKQCYQLLQDELSQKIFKARFAIELEPSPQHIEQIVRLGEQKKWLDAMEKSIPVILCALEQNPKKLILYGANDNGRSLASFFLKKNIDFYGFCSRGIQRFPNGIMGKPVISPDCLFQNPDDFYVVLAVKGSDDEIRNILKTNHFPQDQILSSLKPDHAVDSQYFDFPSLFHRGTAFVDCGCLNCRTSYLFADWCEGEYSKIYAFEPDPTSYSACEQNLSNRKIRNFHLIRAGVSDHIGEVSFSAGLYNGSYITTDNDTNENVIVVPVTTIDHTVGEEKIGFIKMDVEGAEFDALHGARKVIVRDKPLLAISVYHRTGDMLAIMDYLHAIVPEYRFWLRHYSVGIVDTVLYASVDKPR